MPKTKSTNNKISNQTSKSTRLTSYPLEFKESSVKLALESDCPIAHTARNLGINVNTLYNWISQSSNNNQSKNNSMKSSSNNISFCLEENKQLKARLAKVTQERDLLKKAAAYFAKESQ
ncbi:MAG: transposase [Candidatus Delongbacteria bacterium]|jgi:transposase|nr:transposase [Candidatus Delongbacteria bacterium]